MSTLLKIRAKIDDVKEEYFHRNRLAEESRQRENQAATLIQSWFRSCKVRAYLSHLHKKATIMQKIWRGFAARARLRQMVKAAYFIMKMNFYEEMAVRIQRRWRGFYVRKYIHSYYARKRYLEGLVKKNEQVRLELDEVEELQRRQRERLAVDRAQTAKLYQAQKLHYLLSTQQCPGVFNSPFRPAPHEMELLLRQAKPKPSIRCSPRDRTRLLGQPGAPGFFPPGTPRSPWIKSTKPCCSSRPLLPPIHSKKPQGPFKEPREVWEQRWSRPNPSLRLQNSYTDLDETQKQLRQYEATRLFIDKPFLPFAKAQQINTKYERLLHASTSFPPLAYGRKSFREEDAHQHQEEPFKTVFTTCNVFDKLGRLYSKAGNIV
ncbi:spermatogenesis-associated protein 17 [Myripristis murdjan]|uniref:Spermatogenesis associated 17 n=1 Tax=Myripristis murdjan TaxID=586833 RepID=A0A668A2X6_9TELE|nr:spermatogenesis-associated protein 17 [Myripristis murdjan]